MDGDIVARLRDAAPAAFEGEPVVFAYLFGSRSVGEARPSSDVDIAVYVDGSVPSDAYLDLRLRLGARLSSRGPDVDLLVLNETPLPLAGRILRTREVIYSRDDGARVRYESLTFRMFHDFEIHAEPLATELLRGMAEGRS